MRRVDWDAEDWGGHVFVDPRGSWVATEAGEDQ